MDQIDKIKQRNEDKNKKKRKISIIFVSSNCKITSNVEDPNKDSNEHSLEFLGVSSLFLTMENIEIGSFIILRRFACEEE